MLHVSARAHLSAICIADNQADDPNRRALRQSVLGANTVAHVRNSHHHPIAQTLSAADTLSYVRLCSNLYHGSHRTVPGPWRV